LAGDETDAIGTHAGRECGMDQTNASAAEVSPIALPFQTEYPSAGSQTISQFPPDEPSGSVRASVRDDCSGRRDKIPAIAALSPTTIGAHVETAPIVDHRKRRHGSCLHGHVGGRYGSGGHGNCRETDSGG